MKTLKTTLAIILMVLATAVYGQSTKQIAEFNNKPIVEVSINGKKAWALLDTGTDFTIINSGSKKRLSFETYAYKNDKYKVAVIGDQSLQFEVAGKLDLMLGNSRLYGAILSCNMSNVVNSIKDKTGKHISMIIGLNMMKHHNFVIDLGEGTVSVPQQLHVNTDTEGRLSIN